MILTHYLLNIIFPPVCLACKNYLKRGEERTRRLCATCSEKLGYLPGFLCPVCSRRLPAGEKTCHRDSQFILGAPLRYAAPVARELIHALKYGGLKTAAEPLASILAEYLAESIQNSEFACPAREIENFVFIPIPLHPAKERKRGFNQAEVIAESLKRKCGLPIATDALIKTKSAPSQTEKKNREEREENVRESFKVKNPELIAGRNIFLVDDVFTSGATMREAARILKLAGAKRIIALAAARA